MGIRPTGHVSILGRPRTVDISEGQHNVLNAAKGLLASSAYGKRTDVEPYIPRGVRAYDDVSELTTALAARVGGRPCEPKVATNRKFRVGNRSYRALRPSLSDAAYVTENPSRSEEHTS